MLWNAKLFGVALNKLQSDIKKLLNKNTLITLYRNVEWLWLGEFTNGCGVTGLELPDKHCDDAESLVPTIFWHAVKQQKLSLLNNHRTTQNFHNLMFTKHYNYFRLINNVYNEILTHIQILPTSYDHVLLLFVYCSMSCDVSN